jgi:hypothetical protein
MMCFRDKTYCLSPNCTNQCGRQLTNEVKEAAIRAGQLIACAYFCGELEKEEANDKSKL